MKELNKLKEAEELYSGPFNLYDKEGLKKFENQMEIDEVEDHEEVECCDGCKSLFLFEDDFDNTWCGKCNSLNSIEICKDIYEYLENYGNIWNLE